MKKAEDILDSELDRLVQKPSFIDLFYKVNRSKILAIIKSIQEEVIRETVEECVNNAKTATDYIFDGRPVTIIDQNSILSIADKLIKEL